MLFIYAKIGGQSKIIIIKPKDQIKQEDIERQAKICTMIFLLLFLFFAIFIFRMKTPTISDIWMHQDAFRQNNT